MMVEAMMEIRAYPTDCSYEEYVKEVRDALSFYIKYHTSPDDQKDSLIDEEENKPPNRCHEAKGEAKDRFNESMDS